MPRGDNAGRPPFKPTAAQREKVKWLAIAGVKQDRIVEHVGGIDGKTLRAHFREELDLGKEEILALGVSKIVDAMRRGEAWALCFYMKCRGGWKERQAVEVTGEDGAPVQLQAMREAMMGAVRDLSPEVKIQIAERLLLTDGSED